MSDYYGANCTLNKKGIYIILVSYIRTGNYITDDDKNDMIHYGCPSTVVNSLQPIGKDTYVQYQLLTNTNQRDAMPNPIGYQKDDNRDNGITIITIPYILVCDEGNSKQLTFNIHTNVELKFVKIRYAVVKVSD